MALLIVARPRIRCVRNEMPSLFEEVQDEESLDIAYAQISSKKMNVHSKFFFLDARVCLASRQHFAHLTAFVAAVLICWPHLQCLRGFTH